MLCRSEAKSKLYLMMGHFVSPQANQQGLLKLMSDNYFEPPKSRSTQREDF